MIFAPLLGVTLLPRTMKSHAEGPGRLATGFGRLLRGAMRWRWLTIGLTAAVFAVSLYGMRFVEQQFFPSSDRPELVVDVTLPQNASIAETRAQMDRLETALVDDEDIDHWSSYVGEGAIRFVLAFDVLVPSPSIGQIIVVNKDLEARDRVRQRLQAIAREQFVGTDIQVSFLPLGLRRPAGAIPLGGPDIATVREIALGLATTIGDHPLLTDLTFDWMEPSRVVKVEVLQDKARQLGVTSEDISGALNGIVGGVNITQVRNLIYLVDVLARATRPSGSRSTRC